MPSHIAHYLFGLEAADKAGLAPSDLRYFNLGCQGPDLFLHARMRRPSGLEYGRALHDNRFGTFMQVMADYLTANSLWGGPLGDYVLGFAGHGILDRNTHPYIVYSSGWEEKDYFAHPFLERLLDMEVLTLKTGGHPEDYRFFPLIDLGEIIPVDLKDLLVTALAVVFTGGDTDPVEARVENAWLDTRQVLAMSDGWKEENIRRLLEIEAERGRTRLLGMLHPPHSMGKMDVLNIQRRHWAHPWFPGRRSDLGFMDLYDTGVEELTGLFRRFLGEGALSGMFSEISNASLNSGDMTDFPPKVSDPLPLIEELESLYRGLQSG